MKTKKEDESEKDVETTNGVDSPKVEKAGNLVSSPSENSPSGIGRGSENIGQKSRQSEELHSARLCSHSQDGNSVSPQDDNSALGEAITRKSEKSCAEDYEK